MSPRPKICQMVPTTFHGISSGSAISTRQAATRPALARHGQRDDDAERDLDQQDDAGEEQVARSQQRRCRSVGSQQLLEPVGAVPEELVVAEGVLHRIVDHRHQRDDGREGDDQSSTGSTRNQAWLLSACPSGQPPCRPARRRRRRGLRPDRTASRGSPPELAAPRGAIAAIGVAGERDAGDARAAEIVDLAHRRPAVPASRRDERTNSGRMPSLDLAPSRQIGAGRGQRDAWSPILARRRRRPRPAGRSCPASR